MGDIVRFRGRNLKSEGIRNVVIGMACAAAAGYFGPGIIARLAIQTTPSALVDSGESLVGRASVIDGDTIEIHGERVRFNGIDAPEASQMCADGDGIPYRCGARAAEALHRFLAASSPTHCEFVGRDRYGRFVGNCARADGFIVQRWMVRNGYAMDWPRYSHRAFAQEQSEARAKKIGFWIGSFQPPWEWRAAYQESTGANTSTAPVTESSPISGECTIKGNISSDGERIYHLPGQKWYSRTRISSSKGEKWFCSEAEARAARWRRAMR